MPVPVYALVSPVARLRFEVTVGRPSTVAFPEKPDAFNVAINSSTDFPNRSRCSEYSCSDEFVFNNTLLFVISVCNLSVASWIANFWFGSVTVEE